MELNYWEHYLREVEADGPYLCGAEFTLADVSFFPNLAYMVRCGLQLGISGTREGGEKGVREKREGEGGSTSHRVTRGVVVLCCAVCEACVKRV